MMALLTFLGSNWKTLLAGMVALALGFSLGNTYGHWQGGKDEQAKATVEVLKQEEPIKEKQHEILLAPHTNAATSSWLHSGTF